MKENEKIKAKHRSKNAYYGKRGQLKNRNDSNFICCVKLLKARISNVIGNSDSVIWGLNYLTYRLAISLRHFAHKKKICTTYTKWAWLILSPSIKSGYQMRLDFVCPEANPI